MEAVGQIVEHRHEGICNHDLALRSFPAGHGPFNADGAAFVLGDADFDLNHDLLGLSFVIARGV